MSIIRYLILFFLFLISNDVLAAIHKFYSTDTQASSACWSENPGCSSGYFVNRVECPGTGPNAHEFKYTNSTPPGTYNYYNSCFSACDGGRSLDINLGCSCPTGKTWNGSSCIASMPTCTSAQDGILCPASGGTFICTGTYIAPFTCSPPSGCEHTSFAGCSAFCQGQSVEDPNTHQCIDPVCPTGQKLENHSCVSITCAASQIFDETTNSCKNPDCAVGYSFDTGSNMCAFSGCPSTYTTGTVDGITRCIRKAGGTIGPTSPPGPTSTTVSPDGKTVITVNPDGSTTTTTTTTNPDGSKTESSTTTGGTGSSPLGVELDTSDLASESTVSGMAKDIADIGSKIKEQFSGDGGPDTSGGSVASAICSGAGCGATKSEVNIGAMGGFSHSGVASSVGSCPAPYTVSVLHSAFVVDFQPFCDLAPIIRALLLIAASFVAIRIITAGSM